MDSIKTVRPGKKKKREQLQYQNLYQSKTAMLRNSRLFQQ